MTTITATREMERHLKGSDLVQFQILLRKAERAKELHERKVIERLQAKINRDLIEN